MASSTGPGFETLSNPASATGAELATTTSATTRADEPAPGRELMRDAPHATARGTWSRTGRSSPGIGASDAVSMPWTNAITRASSSCVPAASSNRRNASRMSSALRYGRVVVMAENVSPTARIRAMSGMSSAPRWSSTRRRPSARDGAGCRPGPRRCRAARGRSCRPGRRAAGRSSSPPR